MNHLIKNKYLTNDHMSEINNIDKTVTIGMISFENKLIKLIHDSPWSLELDRRIKHASYWRLVKSQFKTKISFHEQLREIKSKLPHDYETNITTLIHAMRQVTITRKYCATQFPSYHPSADNTCINLQSHSNWTENTPRERQ